MGEMQVATFCGSLTVPSANLAAIQVVPETLSAAGVIVSAATSLSQIPAFTAEQVNDPPSPVASLRQVFEEADAIVLAAPEYAGGVSGSSKNALDWLVGSASLYHKVVAVISAGTTGGVFAIENLVRTLSYQGALVVATLGIRAPRTKMSAEHSYQDQGTLRALRQLTADLIRAHDSDPIDLLTFVEAVVAPYGIDPARFGSLD